VFGRVDCVSCVRIRRIKDYSSGLTWAGVTVEKLNIREICCCCIFVRYCNGSFHLVIPFLCEDLYSSVIVVSSETWQGIDSMRLRVKSWHSDVIWKEICTRMRTSSTEIR